MSFDNAASLFNYVRNFENLIRFLSVSYETRDRKSLCIFDIIHNVIEMRILDEDSIVIMFKDCNKTHEIITSFANLKTETCKKGMRQQRHFKKHCIDS